MTELQQDDHFYLLANELVLQAHAALDVGGRVAVLLVGLRGEVPIRGIDLGSRLLRVDTVAGQTIWSRPDQLRSVVTGAASYDGIDVDIS